jgi:zinc/manganese transport system substrate-binding protein
MKGTTRTIAVAVSAATALALAGCAPSTASDTDELSIVASTDVYGDIAAAIAGDRATVTSIISGPTQDPHSYEATARDQLTLSRADLVIENGGGFDPFIDSMLETLDTEPEVLTVTAISGLFPDEEAHDHAEEQHAEDEHAEEEHAEDEHAEEEGHHHDHGDGNEHVWYSLETAAALADEIAHHLEELDPEGSETYEENAAAFTAGIDDLLDRAHELRDIHDGVSVAVTEPAPLLLFDELGLINVTPDEFSAAVEEGTDVAPAVLLETRSLLESGTVKLLAYNGQTSGAETEQLLELAEAEGIPVVVIAETLPDDIGYLDWMGETLDAIDAALQ